MTSSFLSIFNRLNKLSLELQINLLLQTSRGFLFPYFSHTHTKYSRTTLIVIIEMTSKCSKLKWHHKCKVLNIMTFNFYVRKEYKLCQIVSWNYKD